MRSRAVGGVPDRRSHGPGGRGRIAHPALARIAAAGVSARASAGRGRPLGLRRLGCGCGRATARWLAHAGELAPGLPRQRAGGSGCARGRAADPARGARGRRAAPGRTRSRRARLLHRRARAGDRPGSDLGLAVEPCHSRVRDRSRSRRRARPPLTSAPDTGDRGCAAPGSAPLPSRAWPRWFSSWASGRSCSPASCSSPRSGTRTS